MMEAMHTLRSIPEWRDVGPEAFANEIVPRNRPAVLRGIVAHWPAVREGLRSPEAMSAYLRRFDGGRPVQTLSAHASVKGRFFYREDMKGLNFERKAQSLAAVLERLVALAGEKEPPATYIESSPIPDYLPNLTSENSLPLLPATVVPRIWIGNAVSVQTHFDLKENIACVVAGHRRFTLFPPDQLPNLYVGPFDFTLSGPPVSMVSLHEPDFARYPKFKEALEHAQTAELGPGDAIYIPYFWWHHVESLDAFNVLVNYWWSFARSFASPFDCLLHGILALRDLPPEQREPWRIVFEHYVFQKNGDPMVHLAPEHRGMLSAITPERAREIRSILLRNLSK
jgi:hypothetical protein